MHQLEDAIKYLVVVAGPKARLGYLIRESGLELGPEIREGHEAGFRCVGFSGNFFFTSQATATECLIAGNYSYLSDITGTYRLERNGFGC